MNTYFALAIAIVSEVIATLSLKSSEGFTRLAPSIAVVLGYGCAFYFLSIALKTSRWESPMRSGPASASS